MKKRSAIVPIEFPAVLAVQDDRHNGVVQCVLSVLMHDFGTEGMQTPHEIMRRMVRFPVPVLEPYGIAESVITEEHGDGLTAIFLHQMREAGMGAGATGLGIP